MIDDFAEEYVKRIREAQSDEELAVLVDKIYDDGYQDGMTEALRYHVP